MVVLSYLIGKFGQSGNKKVKTLPDEVVASNLEAESSSPLKVDYGLAARTALQNVKQDLATKEVGSGAMGKVGAGEHRSSGKF